MGINKDMRKGAVRILVVEDHPIVRERLAEVIHREPDLLVCGEAEDHRHAIELVGTTQPHLAIIDLTLKQSHGLDLIKDLRVRHPALPVLVFSMHDEALHAGPAVRFTVCMGSCQARSSSGTPGPGPPLQLPGVLTSGPASLGFGMAETSRHNASSRTENLDARYVGFFACFNQQRFHEAHDVLEGLWLRERSGPRGVFYQGLIQLAGAFVHLQRNRPAPAVALFKLARAKLIPCPSLCQNLELRPVLDLISQWLVCLQQPSPLNSADMLKHKPPRLHLR